MHYIHNKIKLTKREKIESSFRISSPFYLRIITGNIVDSLGRLWWENGFMCTYDQVLTNFLIGDADPTS